jgi:hypothetical protein
LLVLQHNKFSVEQWNEMLQVTSELCDYSLFSESNRGQIISHLSAQFITSSACPLTSSIMYKSASTTVILSTPHPTHFDDFRPSGLLQPAAPARSSDLTAFEDLCSMDVADLYDSTPSKHPFISSDPFLNQMMNGDFLISSPMIPPAVMETSANLEAANFEEPCMMPTTSNPEDPISVPISAEEQQNNALRLCLMIKINSYLWNLSQPSSAPPSHSLTLSPTSPTLWASHVMMRPTPPLWIYELQQKQLTIFHPCNIITITTLPISRHLRHATRWV